mmetsp:Transcript_5016/g.12878  ORF Transcript_5016/g.12878 Transcript_5016/m.12878 type:complete len:142 (-) Transcript_5016:441-866(-)
MDSWEDAGEDDYVVSGAAEEAPRDEVVDDDEAWSNPVERPAPEAPPALGGDAVVVLVNLTALSSGEIHNRFDKNSVNDVDAKARLVRRLEGDVNLTSSENLATGVVRPCGPSVWREALARLRDAHPGQYWAPVWPKQRQSR